MALVKTKNFTRLIGDVNWYGSGVTLDMSLVGAKTIKLGAFTPSLTIEDASGNDYIKLNTDGAKNIILGNTTTNPDFIYAGAGSVAYASGLLTTSAGVFNFSNDDLKTTGNIELGNAADGTFLFPTPVTISDSTSSYINVATTGTSRSIIQGVIPVLNMVATGGAANEKAFAVAIASGNLDFLIVNDNDTIKATPLRVDMTDGALSFGTPGSNFIGVAPNGNLGFNGTARLAWAKITADSVTTSNGTPTGTVADLRVAHDGNFYLVTETAGTGFDTIVDFVSVTAFNWVQAIACYKGNGGHAIAVQLYNWTQTRWDTFNAIHDEICDVATADGYILDNEGFFVPDDTEYIGTGGDAGKVRARYRHTANGAASHIMNIDVTALYQ